MARKPGVRIINGHWFSEAGGTGRYFGRCDRTTKTEALARLWQALADADISNSNVVRPARLGVLPEDHEPDSMGGLVKREEIPNKGSGFTPPRSPYEQTRTNKQTPRRAKSKAPPELISSLGSFAILNESDPAQSPASPPSPPPTLSSNIPKQRLTVSALRDRYLEWIERHRSPALYREAKRHLQRWCDAVGETDSTSVIGADLEAFQESLIADAHALMYVKKHLTSVRAMFNKGNKLGWLPQGFRPFAHVESIRLDPKPLLEGDLPTDAEVKVLLLAAEPKPMLHAIVSVYHATGCRTHELIEARVGDFQPNARTIVLGRHKRSRTLREPIPRTITLNVTAYDLLARQCEGRQPQELIFPNRSGKPFTSVLLDDMFARLRKRAGVREGITPYSFRHLWISEALAAGVDVLLVAKMAGTSVKMIESVYGHFRTQSYTDALAKVEAFRKTRNCS